MSKQSRQISLPFIRIDRGAVKPLYEQLYACIRDAILHGPLRSNDRLPASRLIAEELDISRNVVVMAFEQLALEGYIDSRSGSGSYVARNIPAGAVPGRASGSREAIPDAGGWDNGHPVLRGAIPGGGESRAGIGEQEIGHPVPIPRVPEAFTRLLLQTVLLRNTTREEVIPFQTAIPAFDAFPFATWSKLAARAYRYLEFQHLGYDDAAGYLPLREAITDHLRINRGVNCRADQVLIVNGSQHGVALIAQLLLQPGDQYWMEDPGYVNARAILTLFGGRPCPIPVTSDGMDIGYAIHHYPKARLAYLTPSHQYPLGGTMPMGQRLKLLAWANKNKCWLIEDDYDSELRYQGKPIPSLQGMDPHGNVIYMGTFSKTLFPALRLAYLVLPDAALVESFKLLRAVSDRQSPLTDQLILNDFIREGYFHRHIRKMRVLYNFRLQFLMRQLEEHLPGHLSFSDPAAGMHLPAYFKRPVDEERLQAKAKERGMILPAIKDYALTHFDRPGMLLGYASFSEVKLNAGVMALKEVFG